MSEDNVVNIKDFYNHESRITIVENAIVSINKKFEQVDRKFEHLENKIDSQFKWLIGSMGSIAVSAIGILITLIFKLH